MKKFLLGLIILSFLLIFIPSVAAEAGNGTVCVNYFYRPGCHFCAQASPFIENLSLRYSLTVHKYDVQKPSDYQIYDKLCGIQNIPVNERVVPLVAIGEKTLIGLDQIENSLESEIVRLQNLSDYRCLVDEVCQQINQTANGTEPLFNITKVTLPLITVAAISDSVNPCAIGVLVFLLSFLLISSNQNRRRTLLISSIYIITVYAVYFLAGIEIISILSKLSFLAVLNKIFAGLIMLFGLMSFKDAFSDKAMLAINPKVKPLIEKWVYRVSIPAAIILGIIVAAIELPCTGGMYMAILALLANTVTKSTAILYLLFYNLIFVLPLIVITILFVFGLEGHKVHDWVEKHKKKTRLTIGIILILLGVILFFLK
jgi:cytochrome c biogenesis protein CcdA/thiol-disulfide isomerase/thioredoxin